MAQEVTASDRIDAALARIEAEVVARAAATEDLARRHAALRSQMQDAVVALDAVIGLGRD